MRIAASVFPILTVPKISAFVKRIVGMLLVAVTISGCAGLRLESPPVLEPAPDQMEVMRRTAVGDALELHSAAAQLADQVGTEGSQAAIATLISWISVQSSEYANALGGVYDSGLVAEPTDSDSTPTAPTLTEPPSDGQLVSLLLDAGNRNREAANFVSDGNLARLFGSISAAQFSASVRLSNLLGLPTPQLPISTDFLQVPEQYSTLPPSDSDGVPYDPGVGNEPDAGVPDSDDVAAPSVVGSLENDGENATQLAIPVGLGIGDFASLVTSADGARFAYEVTAARLTDFERAQFRALAERQAERADTWARLGQLSGTAQDPRQVAYAIPDFATPPELVLMIESGLSERYASLIASAAPGTRLSLVDELIESNLTRESWGGAPLAFPGAPDIAEALKIEVNQPDAPTFPSFTQEP